MVFTVVMKMLHAVTLMAVTHVTAILGGVEVDSIAQVRGVYTLLLQCVLYVHNDSHSLMKDVDECVQNIDDCADNATCSDTEGSYECTCDPGFTGDGFNCTGQSDMTMIVYMT